MTKDKVVELIYAAMPYSDQITDLDTTEENHVRFNWRGVRFEVTCDLHVHTIEGIMAVSGNLAILLQCLLRIKNE